MKFLIFLSAATVICVFPSRAAEVVFPGRTFQVADGFTLEIAAAPPLITRPVEACYDEKGRLFLTASSGSNDPVEVQLREKPHRVLQLEDTDNDGVFDRKTVFADRLMFPEGILCHQGAVYVAAPPQIWKFTDKNDDGVADTREVWYDGKTLTGCANDLHGPYAGPDGLIYWCKGAFAEQTHDLPGKPEWKSRASHVFRARPDGTGLECVFTAGMDNPVGAAWTPEGDLMICGTFLQHPEAGRRDGIIHAVRGGVWGKDHDVLDGHPRTGDLMPVMAHQGPAAAAGMCRYERDLLVCQFNLRTVSRHRLIPDGASYHTEDSTLLSSDHPDFHPTDVLQAPDGSILIVDTGGWYKLCCPTSQLAKLDVPGALYRLRRTGGEAAVSAPPPRWTLENPGDFTSLTRQLQAENRHVRRMAVEATGQWPATQTAPGARAAAARAIVPLLMAAAGEAGDDRFLQHAVTYALLEGGDPAAMSAGLAASPPATRRMLLLALAQTDPAAVPDRTLIAQLAAADKPLAKALLFAFSRAPRWRTTAAAWMQTELATQPGPVLTTWLECLSTGAPDLLPDLGGLLHQTADTGLRQLLISAMQTVNGDEPWPSEWAAALLDILTTGPPEEARAAASFFAGGKPPADAALTRALAAFASSAESPPALRLLVLSHPDASFAGQNFPFLLQQLTGDSPEARRQAASAIGRLTPDEASLRDLAGQIREAGLLERPLLLPAFRKCADPAIGSLLLDELQASGSLSILPDTLLAECTASFPAEVRSRVRTAKEHTGADRAEQLRRLTELEATLPAGDPSRGSVVFHSVRAACLQCHKIGYKGGTLGPDLTRIGAVRTQRDLLEAVLFPGASFVRSYESVDIECTDGTRLSGIIRNQGATALTVATGAGTPEISLALSDIRSLTPGQFSLMPAAFGQILTPAELADLIAWLQTLR